MINYGYLEPITHDTFEELEEGEWIWDNEFVSKREHGRTLYGNSILEPYGFRQVHILDDDGKRWGMYNKFMLSDHDRGYYKWEYFEEGRYYRFKKEKEK